MVRFCSIHLSLPCHEREHPAKPSQYAPHIRRLIGLYPRATLFLNGSSISIRDLTQVAIARRTSWTHCIN
jgi:hypothetical protein